MCGGGGGGVSHHTRLGTALSDTTEPVSVRFHADGFDVALAVYADIQENGKLCEKEEDDNGQRSDLTSRMDRASAQARARREGEERRR